MAWLGGTSSGLLMLLESQCWQGLQSLKTWLGMEDLLPRWSTHVAVGRKPQFFAICATLLCCLNVPIWQLAPRERVVRQRERERGWEGESREQERCNAFMTEFQKSKSDPLSVGRELGSAFCSIVLKTLWTYFKTTTICERIFVRINATFWTKIISRWWDYVIHSFVF